MQHLAAYLAVAVLGLVSAMLEPAYAVGSSDGSSDNTGGTSSSTASEAPDTAPLYAAAKTAVDAGNYAGALPLLEQITSAEPRNADAWNLLGFSNRKLGQMEAAAKAYRKALRINPGHLGALEYQGEMFVQLGQIDKAMANLSKLQGLCGVCEEMIDLQEAIDAAKS